MREKKGEYKEKEKYKLKHYKKNAQKWQSSL